MRGKCTRPAVPRPGISNLEKGPIEMANLAVNNKNLLVANVLLDTGDAAKDLVAAPTQLGSGATDASTITNCQLYLYSIEWKSITAAAQAIVVQALAGGQIVLEMPASVTAGASDTVYYNFLPLGLGKKLTATPAAAGPKMRFIVTYAILP